MATYSKAIFVRAWFNNKSGMYELYNVDGNLIPYVGKVTVKTVPDDIAASGIVELLIEVVNYKPEGDATRLGHGGDLTGDVNLLNDPQGNL